MHTAWISAASTAVAVAGVALVLPLLWIAWWELADAVRGPRRPA
jgi:hypothetical protein